MTSSKVNFILLIALNLFTLLLATSEECAKKSSEKPTSMKIKEHVLCDYDRTIRPVLDNTAVTIKLFLVIHNFKFREHSNTLEVNAWAGMKWKDEHIYWNLNDFNNQESIFVKTDDIWLPDISVYNRGPYADSELIQESSDCLIYYHKQVICTVPIELEGMCWPNLKYWPFDSQNCTIEMGSWYHTGEEINLNDTQFFQDTSKTELNSEWNLEDIKLIKNPGRYKHSPNDTFPSIRMRFLIRRHYSAKIVFVLIPYLVLILMTILIAWLDPKHPERIYIAALSIPCHIMYLLNATWDLPETADTIPYLVQLLRNSQCLATLTLIESIIVRWLLNKTSDSPRWLLIIFSYVGKNKFTQLLLFSQVNPENVAENVTADDSANLVEFKEEPKEWYLLGRIVDRLYFLFLICFCFIMFIICIPK